MFNFMKCFEVANELKMLELVNSAKSEYDDLIKCSVNLFAKFNLGTLDKDEELELQLFSQLMDSAQDKIVDIYNNICSMYNNNLINKKRFKNSYYYDICELFNSGLYKKQLDKKDRYVDLYITYNEFLKEDS